MNPVTIKFELSPIDRNFAEFIRDQAGNAHGCLELAALVSNAVGEGHICLYLPDIAGKTIQAGGKEIIVPELGHLRECLQSTSVVGAPGVFRPLILDGKGRLYVYRYWKYEHDLARVILANAAEGTGVDETLLENGLRRVFPPGKGNGIDWQKVAAAAALRKRFCVISGGPGTGKTSTVVKILALLLEQSKRKVLRIAIAAPTGKSAARLKESIRLMKEKLNCAAEIRDRIPEEVSTIHRLLGSIRESIRFRYSEANVLPHDVVIVDEASMVSLPLMAKLAMALKKDARLIPLGDRDQLASVEAGAVLGDICGGARQELFSSEFADFIARVTGERIPVESSGSPCLPLTDSLVILKKNYRFRSDSGIGAIAAAVNAGKGEEAIAALIGKTSAEITWRAVPKPERLKSALAEVIVAGYRAYLTANTPAEALKRFDAFRVLCAVRQGPYGVADINAVIEKILAQNGLIDPRGRWYRGRPVMITVNDYNLKLFNGDVGILFPDEETDGTPRVYFPESDGTVRKLSPVRLPTHETVFAMTIHKSQGSEFDRVLLLLPDQDSEVLTRELIYTALTRAREEVEIWAEEAVFIGAVKRKIERSSGLADALWSERRHQGS